MPEAVTILSHWARCYEEQADENIMTSNTVEHKTSGELVIGSPVRGFTEGWARGSAVSKHTHTFRNSLCC